MEYLSSCGTPLEVHSSELPLADQYEAKDYRRIEVTLQSRKITWM